MTAGIFFDANQNERRFERYRTKRADRYSVQATASIFCGDNRYATGKATERSAKFVFTYRH
jgi:hypothetical protein